MNHWYIHTLIWHVPSHHQVVAHKGTNTHTHAHTHTHLLKPLLLQTDDIEVKVCPQAVGPVESDSPRQAIPVGLMRERERRTHREYQWKHPTIGIKSATPLSNIFLIAVVEGKQSKSVNKHTLSISPSSAHCFFLYSLLWHQGAYTLCGTAFVTVGRQLPNLYRYLGVW